MACVESDKVPKSEKRIPQCLELFRNLLSFPCLEVLYLEPAKVFHSHIKIWFTMPEHWFPRLGRLFKIQRPETLSETLIIKPEFKTPHWHFELPWLGLKWSREPGRLCGSIPLTSASWLFFTSLSLTDSVSKAPSFYTLKRQSLPLSWFQLPMDMLVILKFIFPF